MRNFIYKAKDNSKELITGTLQAETEQEALGILSQMGYFPLSIESEETASSEGNKDPVSVGWFFMVRKRDITLFTRQLADLLESGIPLMRALDILREQTENRRLQDILSSIALQVRDGKSFSEALAFFPKVFSNLYVSMVRSGEVGGMLNEVLARLADFGEKDEELRAKVRAALAYPILILFVGMATVAVLLIFVVPKLVSLFQDMGQILPLPTRILIEVSEGLVRYWWAVLSVGVLGGFLMRRGRLSQGIRLTLDGVKLRLPIWGTLIKKVEIASFARSLATLLGHGVPVLQAMQVVVQATENELLKGEFKRIGEQIKGGTTLSQEIRRGGMFPALVTNIVAIGEEAGTLDRSLLKIADTYEREADRAMKLMTSLVEPVMILVMGSIVGFIVIAMLMPIFEIDLLAR